MSVSSTEGSSPVQESSPPEPSLPEPSPREPSATPTVTPQSINPPADPAQTTNEWLDSWYLRIEDTYTEHSYLSVRDFINYLRSEIPDTAYFTNEMIDWALEAVRLRNNLSKSSNTVIAYIDISRFLYAIGVGKVKDETPKVTGSDAERPIEVDALQPKTLQQQFPKEYGLLSGKRYVFLPVCNGFAQEMSALAQHNKNRTEIDKAAAVEEGGNEDVEMTDVTGGQGKVRPTTPKESTKEVVDKDSAVKPTASNSFQSGRELGSHWSFIVIDTLRRTARYIDSVVEVTPLGKKKYRISNINWNAPTAGKVLCGFDTFMNRKKGDFDARTLKWTPHQFRHNRASNDVGACGPYLYALMDFILRHRNTTPGTLGPKGLDGYFRENNKAATRATVGFDSSRSRRQIQEQLEPLRLSKEAAGDGSGTTLHPVNLDPVRLLAVLRPDALRPLLTGEVLKKLLNIHEPPAYDADDWAMDPVTAKEVEAMYAQSKTKNHASNQTSAADDNLLHYKVWSLYLPLLEWKEAQKHIEELLSSGDSTVSKEWDKRQGFAIAHEFIEEKFPNGEFQTLMWANNAALRAEYNAENDLPVDHPGPTSQKSNNIGPHPKRIDRRNRLVLPDGVTTVPVDFANEEEVDNDIVALWMAANKDCMGYIFPPNPEINPTTLSHRAALQACSGQSFADETDDRCTKIWVDDPYAITPGVEWSAAAIRLRMRKTYEDVDGLPVITHPDDDEDDDDDDDDSGDGSSDLSGGKDTTGSRDTPGSKDTSGGKDTTGSKATTGSKPVTATGGKAKSKQTKFVPNTDKGHCDPSFANIPPHTRPVAYPRGKSEDEIPDFVDADEETVETWMKPKLNKELFKRWTVSDQTQRAVLHRTYKGSFKTETEKALQQWFTDELAFTAEERKQTWTASDIAERMDEQYCKLDVPLFASLSDDEIDIWSENVPLDVMAKWVHKHNYPMHRTARGLLHRLFHCDFKDVSLAEDNGLRFVNAWRAADPQISKDDYPTPEDAFNQMKALYDGYKLPFLRESPLHWPKLKYRKYFKQDQGTKRKRDESDEGQGATKRPKLGPMPEETKAELIDWGTISLETLNKFITDDIRNDERITDAEGTPNEYTYRALLFAKQGYRFAAEAAYRFKEIWWQDTAVFNHRVLGEEGPAGDVLVNEDGTLAELLIEMKDVKERMVEMYDPKPKVKATTTKSKSKSKKKK